MSAFRIGHDPDLPPLNFVENGASRGLVIDIAAETFRRIGRDAAFVPVPHARLEAALDGGIDGIAFQGIVPERQARFDFAAPYLVSGGAWFVRAGSAEPAGSARVVTPAAGPLAGEIARRFPAMKREVVPSYRDALNAVRDGRAEAAALNLQVGAYLCRRDFPGLFQVPRAPFAPVPIALAVKQGAHADLLAAFSRALADAPDVVAKATLRWLG
jgi:ABC-type amino acid transport substrate-binding protein